MKEVAENKYIEYKKIEDKKDNDFDNFLTKAIEVIKNKSKKVKDSKKKK
ncbi:MAG: hypothetical protein QM532_04130 [Cyanobium sp. MAG06]|nr:hypothetical protein [Cyanobium sp. MAG06]